MPATCASATSSSSPCRRRSTGEQARLRPCSAPAARSAGLKRGDVVIYESTVYPGATEEDCVPVLEEVIGAEVHGADFFCGYSPERINPGDPNTS